MGAAHQSTERLPELLARVQALRERTAQRHLPFSLWDHFNQACKDFLHHPENGFAFSQEGEKLLGRKWTRIPAASFVDIKEKSLPFMQECALAANRTDNKLPPLIMPLRYKKTLPIEWDNKRIHGPGYKCHRDSPLVSTIFSFSAQDEFNAAANSHEPVYLIGIPDVHYHDDPNTQNGRLVVTVHIPSGGVYKGELPEEVRLVLKTQPSGFVPPREFALT